MQKPKSRNRAMTLEHDIAKAKASGKYMVAVWSVSDETLTLKCHRFSFPVADFDGAISLLRENLGEEKSSMSKSKKR